MENVIYLKDVLHYMHSKDSKGDPLKFDIELREFSLQNKTGGKYKVYNDACLLTTPSKKRTDIKALSYFYEDKTHKNPNHWQNRTRNLQLANKQIKKINILFIIKFNGKEVIY